MKTLAYHENVPQINNNFSVKVIIHKDKNMLTPHWHEHVELLYFFDGTANFTCNDKTSFVEAGDLVLVNPSEVHTYDSQSSASFCCIILYPLFFADIDYDSNISLCNFIFKDEAVKKCIDEIMNEHMSNTVGSDMVIKGCTYRLMSYLVRNYTSHKITEKEALLNRSKRDKLTSLIYYISNNYYKKITSEDMASVCYMNKSHFCRFFKKSLGKSPIEFLNDYRIEKACELLAETNMTITEIAFSVGFEDINYFSRVFKRKKAVSPTEYKRCSFK